MLKKKNVGHSSKNYRTFYPKNCHKALKNMGLGSGIRDPRSGIRDPGSGIRDPGSEIGDPGSEIRDPRSGIRKKPIPDPRVKNGSRIMDSDPQHCKKLTF